MTVQKYSAARRDGLWFRSRSRLRLLVCKRVFADARRACVCSYYALYDNHMKDPQTLRQARESLALLAAETSVIGFARGLARVRTELGLPVAEIARLIGRSRSAVANTLRLLALPRDVGQMIDEGKLSPAQALWILSVPEEKRREIAARVVSGRVGRKALIGAVSSLRPRRRQTPEDANTRAAEEGLRMALGTRVEIVRRKQGAVVRIHCRSETELMRIFDHLTSPRTPEKR